jgi:hypothetical protein
MSRRYGCTALFTQAGGWLMPSLLSNSKDEHIVQKSSSAIE